MEVCTLAQVLNVSSDYPTRFANLPHYVVFEMLLPCQGRRKDLAFEVLKFDGTVFVEENGDSLLFIVRRHRIVDFLERLRGAGYISSFIIRTAWGERKIENRQMGEQKSEKAVEEVM